MGGSHNSKSGGARRRGAPETAGVHGDTTAIQPCRTHPDCIRLIDEAATKKATEYYRTPTAGYTPCPKCIQIAENQELKKYGVPENLIHARFENFTPDGEAKAEQVSW